MRKFTRPPLKTSSTSARMLSQPNRFSRWKCRSCSHWSSKSSKLHRIAFWNDSLKLRRPTKPPTTWPSTWSSLLYLTRRWISIVHPYRHQQHCMSPWGWSFRRPWLNRVLTARFHRRVVGVVTSKVTPSIRALTWNRAARITSSWLIWSKSPICSQFSKSSLSLSIWMWPRWSEMS